jgi:predicted ATP-binding protein involved in virulence
MKLEFLEIKNFRCFSDFKINFGKQLTVIVGANGAGKSTILDALAVLLKCLMEIQGLPENNYPSIPIRKSDKSIDSDENTYFNVKFNGLESINLQFKEVRHDDKFLYVDNIPQAIIPACEKLLDLSKNQGVNIFVYYSAQRCLPEDYRARGAHGGRKAAFKDAFSPNIDFYTSLRWFDEKDAEEARKRSNERNLEYRDWQLFAVRNAIIESLGADIYEYPHMKGVPPELYINKKADKKSYQVNQLSDGYKTMLALVVDLARRMAAVNGEKFVKSDKSILETEAIVLIDEIELHLHPSWQQTVLPSLMNIFPNTQFIVSTHSPQVLTSIKAEYVRVLFNGYVSHANTITYGTESAHVLNEVFGVPSRPNNEVKEVLDNYLDLVNENQGDTHEAKRLREKLDGWLSGDPVLTQADMFIQRGIRRKAREEKGNA